MTEKQLIAKIEQLRQIKPDSSWVSLTKSQILGEKDPGFFNWFFKSEKFVFGHKLAFATLTVFVVFIGVFGFAQNSVPGDSLFTLKKITEQSQSIFIAEKDQPKHNLELANKRLDDLTRIVEKNEVDSLATAISEYKESVAKVAGDLASSEKSSIISELAIEIQKLEEKENQIKSLGIEIGENEELNNVMSDIIKKEIEQMEGRELAEEEIEALNNIKFEYEQGNYSKALEILLLK